MKRSPLKRKTRLKPMSKSKAWWTAQYQLLKKATFQGQLPCAMCGKMFDSSQLEPHHPAGRVGPRILQFRYLCHQDHQWVHDNSKEARERGLLLPEYDGRKSTPETPNFFNIKL